MKYFFLILLLFLFSVSNGQFAEPKFGKVEMADLTMTRYDRDSTAAAVYLFDNGESKFLLTPDRTFQLLFERHLQIRIFKKSALSLADFKILLYRTGMKSEKLSELKAVTYNLVDGKIVKTKLDNDKVYRSATDNVIIVSFAFPEVKEGSVLELSYAITSDFFYNFRGWRFQSTYPERWNQFRYEIPEYYQYRQSSRGYLSFQVNKTEPGSITYNINTTTMSQERVGGNEVQTQTLTAPTVKGVLGIKDVPAFVPEPNIDCEDNYLQSLDFEISTVQFPNSVPKDYSGSWESVNKDMLGDEEFGKLVKTNGFIKDTVSAVCSNLTTELDKAVAIYTYLQNRMKWDGTYHIWSQDGLKKPFNERVGSSSELNLLLNLMLTTAGLNSSPVLFSTRDNGVAASIFPTITKFNSVLTSVSIGDKTYLLDITSKLSPFGVLPTNDINGRGRIINSSGGGWANLDPVEKFRGINQYTLNLDADGKFSGLITSSSAGYAGMLLRKDITAEKNIDDYIRKVQENTKGLTVNKFAFTDVNNIYKPVSDSMFVDITDNAEIIGDKIMFKPLLFEVIEKNRYTLEERKYPVNYNYPVSERYIFTYTIPDGYSVESLPASGVIKMPDNSISVSYNIQASGNKITLGYKFNVDKILFLPPEYANIRSLYDQIVKKHSEQVILKKGV